MTPLKELFWFEAKAVGGVILSDARFSARQAMWHFRSSGRVGGRDDR